MLRLIFIAIIYLFKHINFIDMKKLLSIALVMFLATATVSASSYNHDKNCNKECCKKDPKCKEACKDEKCTKEECAKKCEPKPGCGSKQKAS